MKNIKLCLALILTISPASADTSTAQMRLIDGFDGTDFTDAGGLYYRDNHEQSSGTVEFQQNIKKYGDGALRLSVKSQCTAAEENCSERAEIWEKTALRVPYDTGVWYGFSVLFDDPPPSDDHRYVIAQWKREIGPEAVGDFSPFLGFRVNEGRLFATIETNYHPAAVPAYGDSSVECAKGQTPVWLRPETNQMRLLVAYDDNWTPKIDARFNACTDKTAIIKRGNSMPEPGSGWIDFAVYSRPGADGDGHVEIFANGKWVVTIKGNIGHNDYGLGENQYFKFGPYRAGAKDEWTLYYDNFIRSPDCRDLLTTSACDLLRE